MPIPYDPRTNTWDFGYMRVTNYETAKQLAQKLGRPLAERYEQRKD
jgi:hypothetical protein